MSLGPVQSFKHRELAMGATPTTRAAPITAAYVIETLGVEMRVDVLRLAEDARDGTGIPFDESVLIGLREWQKRWA